MTVLQVSEILMYFRDKCAMKMKGFAGPFIFMQNLCNFSNLMA